MSNVRPLVPRRSSPKPYKPNTVPAGERHANTVMGVVLFAYGVAGLLNGRIDLNGRRVRIAVFEGGSAWLVAAAFMVGAAVLFAAVVDHYDTRNNESHYRAFKSAATRLGWCLVAAASVLHIYASLFLL